MDLYQQFIHLSRYARYLPDEHRRETWPETVARYISFWESRLQIGSTDAGKLERAIRDLEVMPSMRALMTAGPALERDNIAGYNCFFRAITKVNHFPEIMYVLMNGAGAGFSVERQFIADLPVIPDAQSDRVRKIIVGDSKEGWCIAFRKLLKALYRGEQVEWDLSKIRPAGEPLKTFGGRASGPEPLEDLFKFTKRLFDRIGGRKLNSLEVHDLVCKIAEVVVVGGVRRSALLSLSNLTDERMRKAKHGSWNDHNPQRQLANNSVCYTEKPDLDIFMREWLTLHESKCGERGLFSRPAAEELCRRIGRDVYHILGTNPCAEIILRSGQFCNLSEVVCRATDSLERLKEKVKLAAILGTLQSTLTNFKFIEPDVKKNCEEERLLGLSLTGIMDHPIMNGGAGGVHEQYQLSVWLKELRKVARQTNRIWAKKLGIKPAAAITCVKPSGTVSQLVNSSSGIHPRFSPYYIRRVRADVKDPLCDFMKAQGIPWEEGHKKPEVVVFSFPQASPKTAVNDMTAMQQLRLWLTYQEYWCDHKPSQTVYYTDDEFLEVGAWVYKNFDKLSGISFFPKDDSILPQLPYEAITKEEYERLVANQPFSIDWSEFKENQDNTIGSQTMACSAGICEITDLTKDG